MGLNETPSANRLHIGIFGNRNAGKSSLINGITGQDLAIVSSVKGTTTDPVQKAMELLPLGPVVMIDTPGLDDEGALGAQRVKKSLQVLRKTDCALLVLDGTVIKSSKYHLSEVELELIQNVEDRKIPFFYVINKCEEISKEEIERIKKSSWYQEEQTFFVSAATKEGIRELKDAIAKELSQGQQEKMLVRDLLKEDDVVVLVTPIDEAAPKGRMILPQQQTIRDILDGNAICMVTKETQLERTLNCLKESPRLVITDSQAFKIVNEITPKQIPLTSFSILFARLKGNLPQQVKGAVSISKLEDGDKVLIAEGCTHHRQCGDIGTEKLPKLLKKFTGKDLQLDFCSGTQFPENICEYRIIIHCGGCMLNEKEMQYRLSLAREKGIPMTNYGVAIAYMNGILARSLELFPEHKLL